MKNGIAVSFVLTSFPVFLPYFLAAMEVPAGPLRVVPYAEPLFFDGRVELHPTTSIGGGYDSNLNGSGTSDFFAHGTAGGHGHYYINLDLDADLDVQVGRLRYRQTPSRDTTELSSLLDIFYRGPAWNVGGAANGDRGREPEPITGEQILRNRFGGRLAAERKETGPYIKASNSFERINYLEDSTLFDRDQADRTKWKDDVRLGWRTQRDTKMYGVIMTSIMRYDQEGRFRNGVLGVIGAGSSLSLAPEWTAEAEAGLAFGTFSSAAFDNPDYDDQHVRAPYSDLGLRWDWEESSSISIRAESGLNEGRTANAVYRRELSLDFELRLRQRLRAFSECSWSREEDSGAAAGTDVQVRNIIGTTIGMRGTPVSGVGLQLSVGESRTTATDGDGFNRLVIEFSVGFAF